MSTNPLALRPLVFQSTVLDVVDRAGQPWLRGPQIAGALGYSRADRIADIYARNAAEFTDSMTAVVELDTAGGRQPVRVFSLRGAHLLGMFARTPIAAEFRRWVLDILDQQPTRASSAGSITPDQREALGRAIRELCSGSLMPLGGAGWVYNHLRQVFDLRCIEDMSPAQFPVALQMVASKREAASDFVRAMNDTRKWFASAVLGGGEPWTPALKSRLSRELKTRVSLPERVDWKRLAADADRDVPGTRQGQATHALKSPVGAP